jgi:hypothetical protein
MISTLGPLLISSFCVATFVFGFLFWIWAHPFSDAETPSTIPSRTYALTAIGTTLAWLMAMPLLVAHAPTLALCLSGAWLGFLLVTLLFWSEGSGETPRP